MSTIFALSSGRPPAAIAIVRVSGPDAFAAVRSLSGDLPPPRHAALRTLRAADGDMLDRALVLTFPAPNSVTGEDLAELHLHGGRAVVSAVEAALATSAGLRPAEPGEFTRRALERGRIDLSQAHGLADLLEAESEGQRRAALTMAEGKLSAMVRAWLDTLTDTSAQLEAAFDYAEEGDVGQTDLAAVRATTAMVADEIGTLLARPPVERWRDGIRVVLAGPPNAGKSSLFNALLARNAAIVTPIAGTTRDTIEANVLRVGIPYVLVDTAGLRESADAVEAIGIERARQQADAADVVLWLSDAAPPAGAIVVHPRTREPGRATSSADALQTDVADHQSIERLWCAIAGRASGLLPSPDVENATKEQRAHLHAAVTSLLTIGDLHDEVLVAEHIRAAHASLSRILGVDALNSILDRLFSRFCLGK